jgi:2-oxoglutarate dehydrogenase E1 component
MRLAFAYRQEFKRDVVVDLVCYRRWGHNEADDPSYTHPILYAKIEKHRSVRKLYTERLMRSGDLDVETAERALEDFRRRLEEVHREVQRTQEPSADEEPAIEVDLAEPDEPAWQPPDTGVSRDVLERVLEGLDRVPERFTVHPKLAKQLSRRRERFESGGIDWALAETLCFGSLVLQGTPVRLSGEDSVRGTFSQRHAALFDHHTAESHVPLAHLAPDQAPFHAFDSLLSEFAVLGFEYGYSVGHPEALVMWEAQFGDFVNGAQVILDQFLVSAESKWGQTSGVVLLLPHGYEGQGPEHSSARLERFLQLSARGNLRVAHPSTPAQYFHLLRAQARSEQRKPLVVMTPKSLLRHKACVSRAEELASGRFEAVLDDPAREAGRAERLLLCSGKIFYDLDAQRQEAGAEGVSICRIEQLYPFPAERLARVLERHAPTTRVSWVQEEPRNMGAWSFVRDRIDALLGGGRSVDYVGRPADASPATGSHRRHVAEQTAIVRRALEVKADKAAGAPAR